MAVLIVAAGCRSTLPEASRLEPGTSVVKMEEKAAGFRRSYRLHLPSEYRQNREWPLVVVLHGAFSSARGIEKHSGFSALADREGFVVAYPNGIGLFGLFRHWNAGFCCGKAMKQGLDDVDFVFRVVDEVARSVRIDMERVYVVGNSNGGMLAHRIAATRPERVAAVAVSAGAAGVIQAGAESPETIPVPIQPVPMVLFHGRTDESIPYEREQSSGIREEMELLSAREAVALWVEHNRCDPEPSREQLYSGAVEKTSWRGSDGSAEVVLYTVNEWGHDWPGPHFVSRQPVDSPLRELDAAQLMWSFLRQYRRVPEGG
jgi:polyhydroxybutyrate depolymerase